MRIIEQFIEGKNQNQDLCEDGIFVSENMVAVIDGATAKSDIKYMGKSSGRFAMEMVSEALNTLDKSLDAFAAVDYITKHMENIYKQLEIYERLKENYVERPSACAIIYNHTRKEVWQIGDCMSLIDGVPFYNNKMLDEIVINARCLYLQIQIEQGKKIEDLIKNDEGREFIYPLIKNQGILQNNFNGSEYAWEIFDGFPILKNRIKVIDVSNAKTLILASDGYPKLFGTLTESENYVKYVNEKDPLCFTLNRGTKALKTGNNSFDDRAYIRIEL